MKKNIFSFLLTVCYLSLHAGGFQVNLQGQKQTGMGHTGTGLLLDGASVLFNPGSMIFLDSASSLTGGMNLIFPRCVYLEQTPGIYTTQMVHNVGTPFSVYSVMKIRKQDKFNLGLGIYTPFGSLVQWPNDWKGQFLLRTMDLQAIFFQPTISYKVSDKIGIGIGVVVAQGNFSLTRGVQVQDSLGHYGSVSMQGTGHGFGFNGGIYFKPNKKFSVGMDYRSSVKLGIDNGEAIFTVPSSLADYFPNTTFSSHIKLPSYTTLGFGYAVNEKLKLSLDVNYAGWSSYDTLAFIFKDTTSKLQNIHSPRKYKNSFIFRVGAQYQLLEKLVVRCGAYYDMTPVPDGYVTPETPDGNKIAATAGASWHCTKRFNLDFSLLYEQMKRTDTSVETGFSGTYKTKVVVVGAGFEYVF